MYVGRSRSAGSSSPGPPVWGSGGAAGLFQTYVLSRDRLGREGVLVGVAAAGVGLAS